MTHRRQCWFVRLALGALLALTATAIFVSPVLAGGGPENVLLVVNPRAPDSLAVANHYVELRRIPPSNVFYLPAPPRGIAMSSQQFRQNLLEPILAEINRRGLKEQIDYVVYSTNYPSQVNFSTDFAGVAAAPQAKPIMSITSATFLYELAKSAPTQLVALNSNRYFAPTDAGLTVTRGFRSNYAWIPGGLRAAGQGNRYLLSVGLGFTAPTGNTAEEVIAYLKRSAAADGARAGGTFYYMQNKDVRTLVRQGDFRLAATGLQSLGRKAAITPGVVPAGATDIAGLTTGSPHVNLAAANCRLLPGALVDNLTSAGGNLNQPKQPNPQTRLSAYLRLGAAGASGTVVEPFAIAQKFPSPMLHVHYARGASMAEAFYQSVEGPFQLLIVGDPLCQPWAVIPQVSVEGLPIGGILAERATLTPHAVYADGRQAERFELLVDGVRQGECRPGETLTLDPAALDDGFHEIRVVAVDATPLETQGRWIGSITAKRGRGAVQLSLAKPLAAGDERLHLQATSTEAGPIAVYHNEREVGRSPAGTGPIDVGLSILGSGPVSLQARVEGSPAVRSRPLHIEIPGRR
jgi:hypothetical protein